MSTRREQQFQCAFTAGSIETAVHVAAWDARSAEDLFREALLASGIHVPGTIRVRDSRGRVAREARFEPRGSAPVAEG